MPVFILQIGVVTLKFLVPALMLASPFLGVWANYLLDIVDGDVLLSLGMSDPTYQMVDKFADLISYVFMLIVGRRWQIKNTVTLLFVYRFIGQILFFLTKNELVFFVFQNFLEPLMLIYTLLVFVQKSEAKASAVYRKYILLFWAIILVYKIWNEWYLHYANIDLSMLFFGFTGGK